MAAKSDRKSVKITDTKLQSWQKNPPAKQKTVFDSGGNGFVCRVGKKRIQFCYVYREWAKWDAERRIKWAGFGYYAPTDERGNPPPLPFLTLADARTKHRELVALHLRGERVLPQLFKNQSTQGVITVEDAVERYLKYREGEKYRAFGQDGKSLVRFLYPEYRKADIKCFEGAEGLKLLRPIVEVIREHGIGSNKPSKATALKFKGALSRFLAFVLDKGWIDSHQARDIKTPKVGVRKYHLKDDEIGKFWRDLKKSDIPKFHKLGIQFAFLTGDAVRTSAYDIDPAWVNWEPGKWTTDESGRKKWEGGEYIRFPGSVIKGKREDRDDFKLPLAPKALKILKQFKEVKEDIANGKKFKEIRKRSPENRLFPCSARQWTEELSKYREAMGYPKELIFHTFRKSFNSELQRQRIPQRHIDATITHVVAKGVEGHYNFHAFTDEKRECLEAWEAEIDRQIIEARRSKIHAVK